MSSICLKNYLSTLSKLRDMDYLFSVILYNIAPTVAGEKVSSLVVLNNNSKRNLYKLWIKYKREICEYLNLSYYELRETENSCVVIFYDENQLKQILNNKRNQTFLKKFGYKHFYSINKCLSLLKKRYEYACPHEIGIFLGYPLDDVIDFIHCPNKQCLLSGYWKVYNDKKSAEEKFNKYDAIKSKVIALMVQGYNLQTICSCI